jgi:acyl-CoA thioester hydrolase
MNVMWYTGKFDEASWQLLSRLGLTQTRLRKECAAMAAVEQHTVYKHELFAGDVISVRSSVLQLGKKSIHLFHEMRNDETGEVAATSTIVGVYMNAAIRRAQPWPLDVREHTSAGFNDQEDELHVYSGRDFGDQERSGGPSIQVCG